MKQDPQAFTNDTTKTPQPQITPIAGRPRGVGDPVLDENLDKLASRLDALETHIAKLYAFHAGIFETVDPVDSEPTKEYLGRLVWGWYEINSDLDKELRGISAECREARGQLRDRLIQLHVGSQFPNEN